MGRFEVDLCGCLASSLESALAFVGGAGAHYSQVIWQNAFGSPNLLLVFEESKPDHDWIL